MYKLAKSCTDWECRGQLQIEHGGLEFINRTLRAKVNKIHLIEYEDSSYRITVKMVDHDEYKEFLKLMQQCKLPLPNYPDTENYTYKLKCDNLVPNAVVLIKALAKFDFFCKEIEHSIGDKLKIDLSKEYEPEQWLITGDFSKEIISGATLNKKVKFLNSDHKARIKEILLLGYNDDSYQIAIEINSSDEYKNFLKLLQELNLPIPKYPSTEFNTYRLRCDVLVPHAVVLLQSLAKFDERCKEIESRIEDELKIDLSKKYEMSNWLIQGSFTRYFISGAPLNRMVELSNGNPSAKINKVELLGYYNNSYQIVVEIRDKAVYKNFIKLTKQLMLPESDFFDYELKQYRLRCTNLMPDGVVLLQSLSKFDEMCKEIESRIEDELKIDLSVEVNRPKKSQQKKCRPS